MRIVIIWIDVSIGVIGSGLNVIVVKKILNFIFKRIFKFDLTFKSLFSYAFLVFVLVLVVWVDN